MPASPPPLQFTVAIRSTLAEKPIVDETTLRRARRRAEKDVAAAADKGMRPDQVARWYLSVFQDRPLTAGAAREVEIFRANTLGSAGK